MVCESSLSASIFSGRTHWSPVSSDNGAADGADGADDDAADGADGADLWGLAQTTRRAFEGLQAELPGRRSGPSVSVKRGTGTAVSLHSKWVKPPSISFTISSKSPRARRTSFLTKYPRADA